VSARERVGVMVPTYNRPDLLRACVLQLAAQSRPPDVICVHQNGHPESYDWAVADLKLPVRIAWLHTPARIAQHLWYAIPLRWLLDDGCTHFFWADHDDLYLRDHIAAGLQELVANDFSISRVCGVLYTKGADYRFHRDVPFTSHAPGGMSSTMCFNRAFAAQLHEDLLADRGTGYSDNVLAKVTMPKFRCYVSARRTAVYHSHAGSVSSSIWLDDAFK
jgi:hypothetical protein